MAGEPVAPSGLSLTVLSSSGIRASWVDNSTYSAGQNEIRKILFVATPVSGSWTMTFDLETSAAIAYDADAATVEAALEAMPSIGTGNVSVTTTTGGFLIEFVGAAANLAIASDAITIQNSLKQAADTIDVTVTQSGIADVASTPSISTTTTAVEPVTGVAEVEVLSLGGATTGTFNLSSADASSNIELDAATIDASAIESAVETMGGAGVSVADNMDGSYTITWDGAPGALPLPLQVTGNSTDGSPSVSQSSAYVLAVIGVHQVDTITFSATPAGGSMTINMDSLAWDADASTISISGAVLSGTPSSGTITVTWDDYEPHTPPSVDGTSLLSVVGRTHIFTIELSDAPTEGSLDITRSGDNSTAWPYNATAAAVESAIEAITGGYACSVTGSDGGPWTVTSDGRIDAPTWTANAVDPLLKDCDHTFTTEQDGTPQEWAELGFWIQTSLDGSSWSDFIELGVNVTTWDLSGLDASTLYYIRVRAYNASGDSGYTDVESATTNAAGGGGYGTFRHIAMRPF